MAEERGPEVTERFKSDCMLELVSLSKQRLEGEREITNRAMVELKVSRYT